MSATPKATTNNVDAMLGALEPDTDKPADLTGPWLFNSLVETSLEIGVWEAGPDTWHEDDYSVEEMMMIVDGRLRLTEDDGTVLDLRAGDLIHLPKGWRGTWEVVETLRKVYVILPE